MCFARVPVERSNKRARKCQDVIMSNGKAIRLLAKAEELSLSRDTYVRKLPGGHSPNSYPVALNGNGRRAHGQSCSQHASACRKKKKETLPQKNRKVLLGPSTDDVDEEVVGIAGRCSKNRTMPTTTLNTNISEQLRTTGNQNHQVVVGSEIRSAFSCRGNEAGAAAACSSSGGTSIAREGGTFKVDPSALYLTSPLSCPAVKDARKFFSAQLPKKRKFDVRLGNTKGWRTVSKLHVRAAPLEKKTGGKKNPKTNTHSTKTTSFQVLNHNHKGEPMVNKKVARAVSASASASASSWLRREFQLSGRSERCTEPTMPSSDERTRSTDPPEVEQDRFHVFHVHSQDVDFDPYGRYQQVVHDKILRNASSRIGTENVLGAAPVHGTAGSTAGTSPSTTSTADSTAKAAKATSPTPAPRKPLCHCEIGMLEPATVWTETAGAKKPKSSSGHAKRASSSSSTVDTDKIHLPSQSMTLVDLSRKKHKSEAHHPVLDRAIQFLRKCIEQCGVPDFRSALERGEVEFEEKDKDQVAAPPPSKKRKVAASASTEPAELGKATTTEGASSTGTASTSTTSNKTPQPVVLHDPQFRKTKSDTLRYVFFGVERATNRAQITLVWNSDEFEKCENLGTLVHEIMTQVAASGTDSSSSNSSSSPCFLHSLWVHSNRLSIHGNCFFEDTGRWLNVFGPNDGCVLERMVKGNSSADHGSTPYLFLPPNVFRQANLKEFGQICLKVRECVVGFAAAKASAAAKAGKSGRVADLSLKDKKEAHKKTDEAVEANSNTISVLELYGGVGTIGLQLLNCTTQAPASTPSDKKNAPAQTSEKGPETPQRTQALISRYECSDANPFNKACFEKSLALMEQCSAAGGAAAAASQNKANSTGSRSSSIFQQTEITYTPKPAKEMVDRIPHYDVLIVDPPRKGLDAEVIEALTKPEMKTDNYHAPVKPSSNKKKGTTTPAASEKKSGLSSPHRVIYISCGFPAFKRDCERLVSSGMWKLTRAEGFVLFPGADHIETFAVFDRV